MEGTDGEEVMAGQKHPAFSREQTFVSTRVLVSGNTPGTLVV